MAVLFMLQLIALPASATETSESWHGFHFSGLDNGTKIQITSYVGNETDIGVPSNIYGTPVTKVSLMGILHYESLRSISIPDTVTEIVTGSLSNCPNLKAVNFLGNAPRIVSGSRCFYNNAPDFKIYYLPGKTGFTNPWCDQPTEVASAPLTDNAYYWASGGLIYKIRPDNSAMIMGSSYYQHDAENLVIPAMVDGHPVRAIAPEAFKNQHSIRKVTLPDGLTSIGAYAFKFSSVLDITLPNSLTRIEEGAFYQSSLDRVSIPPSVTYIGDLTFYNCNMSMVKFFGNAPEMGSGVFSYCNPNMKIYYYPGVTGYSNPWQGYSTEPLPIVPTGGSQQQAAAISLQAQANLGSIRLDWNSITNPKGVTGYNIYKANTAQDLANQTQALSFVTGNTYTDRLVQNGTTYYYAVKPVYGDNSIGQASNVASATPGISSGTIQLTINKPYMLVNGIQKETDAGYGTAPILKDGRTFLPIRAIIETAGGTLQWDGAQQKVTIKSNEKEVELWINRSEARVNSITKAMDVAPFISSTGRTMLPLRFIADTLDLDIAWDGDAQTVTVNYGDLGSKNQDRAAVEIPSGSNTIKPPASLPAEVPGSIPAPSISNLQLLKYDSGVPYFLLEVNIPDAVRTLDQVRPADGWVDLESLKIVDDEEEIADGGGLEVFMEAPAPGKSGVYYITFEVLDEGGCERSIKIHHFRPFKMQHLATIISGNFRVNS